MDYNSREWKLFYKISAFCVFTAFLVMIAEIFITALPDGARVQLSAVELLEMYNRNLFMGMRFMGLMNIFATSLMIPIFLSFFVIHRERHNVLSLLSLILCLMGYVVFMSDNVSFPILSLSNRYLTTNIESEKLIIISATEGLMAKGASHTPGTFPGFLLGQVGSILFCVLMILGNRFKKSTGILGVIAFTFLLIFEVVSSFVHSLFDQAMILAMIGGISAITWYIKVGIELLKIAKIEE